MIRGLTAYREQFNQQQAARDKVVNQGRRAYNLGIELRNNPLNSPTDRKLWEEGWELARRDTTALIQRMKG